MRKEYTIFLSLVVLSTNSIWATDRTTLDDFYKKAFGGGGNSKSKVFLPMLINGKIHTEVFVLRESQNLFIKEDTAKYIIEQIKPEYRDLFSYKIKKNGYLSTKKLSKEGVEIIFDEGSISLKVIIPPKLRRVQDIDLNSKRGQKDGNITIREEYAGGASFYLNQGYTKNRDRFNRNPLTGSSELFLNIHDYVIEGDIAFDEEVKNKIRRDRVRVTKDDESTQLRYRAGDIYLPQVSRVSRVESLGVSVEKILNMDEDYYQNMTRINSFEFFLKNRSRIEIYINDGFSRALRLDAGTHNLYDLNIPIGLNRVKIKVIEDSGKIEYIEFNDFDYTELYKEGIGRFGMGIGISSKRDIDNKIVYDKKEQFASLYGEYGLTSFFTFKAGAELKDDYQSVVVEPIIGTPIGLFDIYAIGSYQKEDKLNGYKYGLQYRTNIDFVNLSLSGEQTQNEFRTIDSYDINSSMKSTMYRGVIYTPFIWDSSLSLSATKYKREGEVLGEEEQYSVDVRKILTSNLNIAMNYNYNRDIIMDNNNYELYLTLNYRYGDIDTRYSEYLRDEKHLLSISHSSKDYYGLTSNLDLEDTYSNQRASVRADFKDEKFRLNANYNYNNSKHSSRDSQNFNTQFATGVYFAGDSFSISEPINNSYIIVENNEKIEDTPAGIIGYQEIDDDVYDSYIISSGDHQTRELEVNELNLPMGMDIVNVKQSFKSNYKSGSVMHIDVNSFYSVKGRLVDQDGKAIKLRAFKVYNTKTGEREMAFTDENGEFLLSHIEISDYNAILFRGKDESELSKFSFSLKESEGMKNLIDIGEIKIKFK
jgi:outer membrane usher protein FimD/PapC